MHRFLVVTLVTLATSAPLSAQTATATLSVDLGPIAKLSFSSTTLSFADADPDALAQIPASGGPITITAKARAAQGQVVMTVLASGNPRSGVDTLPADAFTWTATGTGFVGGTVSATTPQVVGSWTGSGVRVGSQTFLFRNSWSYPAGVYSMTLTYTLTTP
jgi:hypothetical protein